MNSMKPWEFTPKIFLDEEVLKGKRGQLHQAAKRSKALGNKPKGAERFNEIALALWRDAKINRFYNSYPSHLNENRVGTSVVYFACGLDMAALKDKQESDPWIKSVSVNELAAARAVDTDFDIHCRELVHQCVGHVKIGTTQIATQRLSAIQTGCPFWVRFGYWFRGGFEEEGILHKIFAPDRGIGEWFSYGKPIRDYMETMMVHSSLYDVPRNEMSIFKLIKQEEDGQ